MLRGTPTEGDLGPTSVEVVVSNDRGGETAASFGITVVRNAASVLAGPLVAKAATQGRAFAYALPSGSFTDRDAGDTLSNGATLANGGALPSWLRFDPQTLRFAGTPGNADVGRIIVSVVASDRFGVSTAGNFTLAVANVNDAPVANGAVGPLAAAIDRAFAATLRADLFTDIDAGDRLGIAITRDDGSALPSWLRYDAASRTLSGTPLGSDQGTLPLVARATDLAGASATAAFTLTVSDPPRIVTGSAGDDRLAVPNGRSIVSGRAVTDTAVFSGPTGDYVGTSGANGEARLLDVRGASYILHGVERIAFADGTIDIARAPTLVDPLFYLTHQHNVFQARADATAHYAEFGWRKGRDPSADFDTSSYLAAYGDVAAARFNPLFHYLQAWGLRTEGDLCRQPVLIASAAGRDDARRSGRSRGRARVRGADGRGRGGAPGGKCCGYWSWFAARRTAAGGSIISRCWRSRRWMRPKPPPRSTRRARSTGAMWTRTCWR